MTIPALAVFLAYLIGSIPFGYLIVRMTEGADIRLTGSGGTGATNVSRKAGKAAGLITLVLDAAKGALAILLARALTDSVTGISWVIAAVAVAVLMGHMFPVWLSFRGGKGVATGFGVFLMLAPFTVLVAGLIFLVTVGLTRYVSLGSMLGALAIPVGLWFQHTFVHDVPGFKFLLIAAVVGSVLIVFAHRQNIARLAAGSENKFS